ncbi:hypothetical protein WMY93_028118 [Mugilogobius chulae]|uniref:G-protein coupled receptors family 1 profile domain-containing protein n=1 Tax=Mugilogobius chulae TaxID=88201 RepID=A0AAW0MW58_9GOBI
MELNILNSSSPQTNLTTSHFSSVFTEEVLPPLYLVLCVLGLLLNAVASWVFCSVPSDAALVVYLKNMLVADLLMLGCFPFRLMARLGLGGWRLHVLMCRLIAVVFYSSMYTGVMFMGLISLERYAKIVRHAQTNGFGRVSLVHFLQTPGSASFIAVAAWALMLLSALPNVLLTNREANEANSRRCMELKTELGVRWHQVSTLFSVGVFWLTLVVMATCYSSIALHVFRSYRRVRSSSSACRKSARSILSLLLVFCVCFVPYHVCRVPYTLSQMPWSGFGHNASDTAMDWPTELQDGRPVPAKKSPGLSESVSSDKSIDRPPAFQDGRPVPAKKSPSLSESVSSDKSIDRPPAFQDGRPVPAKKSPGLSESVSSDKSIDRPPAFQDGCSPVFIRKALEHTSKWRHQSKDHPQFLSEDPSHLWEPDPERKNLDVIYEDTDAGPVFTLLLHGEVSGSRPRGRPRTQKERLRIHLEELEEMCLDREV